VSDADSGGLRVDPAMYSSISFGLLPYIRSVSGFPGSVGNV
jgi:hypothetical protein